MQRHFSNRGEALPELTAARMLARRKAVKFHAPQSWMPGKRVALPIQRVASNPTAATRESRTGDGVAL